MRSTTLLLLLLCMQCVAEVRTTSTHALRLCGREFLRAVVFTCGGSRWRRVTGGEETPALDSREQREGGRHRRDLNQDLITACCKFGCRKSDIALLC